MFVHLRDLKSRHIPTSASLGVRHDIVRKFNAGVILLTRFGKGYRENIPFRVVMDRFHRITPYQNFSIKYAVKTKLLASAGESRQPNFTTTIVLSAGTATAWRAEGALEDTPMIETAEQLYQAIEQMGRMQRVLESYRDEILTQNPHSIHYCSSCPLSPDAKLTMSRSVASEISGTNATKSVSPACGVPFTVRLTTETPAACKRRA